MDKKSSQFFLVICFVTRNLKKIISVIKLSNKKNLLKDKSLILLGAQEDL